MSTSTSSLLTRKTEAGTACFWAQKYEHSRISCSLVPGSSFPHFCPGTYTSDALLANQTPSWSHHCPVLTGWCHGHLALLLGQRSPSGKTHPENSRWATHLPGVSAQLSSWALLQHQESVWPSQVQHRACQSLRQQGQQGQCASSEGTEHSHGSWNTPRRHRFPSTHRETWMTAPMGRL